MKRFWNGSKPHQVQLTESHQCVIKTKSKKQTFFKPQIKSRIIKPVRIKKSLLNYKRSRFHQEAFQMSKWRKGSRTYFAKFNFFKNISGLRFVLTLYLKRRYTDRSGDERNMREGSYIRTKLSKKRISLQIILNAFLPYYPFKMEGLQNLKAMLESGDFIRKPNLK